MKKAPSLTFFPAEQRGNSMKLKLKRRWKKYFDGLFTLGLVLIAAVGFGRHYDLIPESIDRVLTAVAVVLLIGAGVPKNIRKLWE